MQTGKRSCGGHFQCKAANNKPCPFRKEVSYSQCVAQIKGENVQALYIFMPETKNEKEQHQGLKERKASINPPLT
jgi:hypothetical protein